VKQILGKILTAIEHVAEAVTFRTEDAKTAAGMLLSDARQAVDELAELDTPDPAARQQPVPPSPPPNEPAPPPAVPAEQNAPAPVEPVDPANA
jgi:hypothetical protein